MIQTILIMFIVFIWMWSMLAIIERWAKNDVPVNIISIAILIVTILVIAKVAIKIYSNAILNYGTKMGIKDIIKMYKDKQN